MNTLEQVNRQGGGPQVNKQKRGSTHVPNKIKCTRCNKTRNKDAYSQRQLNAFALALRRGDPNASTNIAIKCRQCTAAPVTELTCSVCGDIKGLQDFSKAQRKNPDNARCLKCVQMHLETEPGIEPPEDVEDSDEDSDPMSNPYGSEYQYDSDNYHDSAASLTMDKLTISEVPKKIKIASMTSYENAKPGSDVVSGPNVALLAENFSQGGDTMSTSSRTINDGLLEPSNWVTQPRGEPQSSGVPRKVYTAYDPEGVGHPRARTSSTVTGSGRDASLAPGGAAVNEAPTRRGGWVKAKKEPTRTGGGIYAESKYSQAQGKQVHHDSDEDDDEDDDYMKSW